MAAPRLSIILPNFNHAEFLPRCLDSSLEQSFADFELIVIDDCSTDNSYELLQEYARRDSRIRLFRNEKNQGVVATLNRALSLARGDYVHGSAADDYILPGYYEAAMDMFTRHPEAAICVGRTRLETPNSPEVRIAPDPWAESREFIAPESLADRMVGCGIPGPVIWKREPFLKAGAYIPELRWHCDWFTLQVIAFRHGICFVPDVFTVVRMAEDSFSNSKNRAIGAQEQVLHRILKLLQQSEYRDVIPLFERSGIFRQFSFGLVEAVLSFEGPFDGLVEMLKPHILPHAANLLHSASATQRLGIARFLGACGAAALDYDEALAAMERDRYPNVAAAAVEARRAIRQATSTTTLWKRKLKHLAGRMLRYLDRRLHPAVHEQLARHEKLLMSLTISEHETRNETLAILRGLRDRIDAIRQELDARRDESPESPRRAA